MRQASSRENPRSGEDCNAERMLARYHRAVAALFDQFRGARTHRERRQIAERICHLVAAQCRVEDEILYPEATRGRPDNRIRAAQLEGAFVRKIVEQIRSLKPDDRRYAATVEILHDYLTDYVDLQRADVLPRLRRRTPRLNGLCRAMMNRRAQLLAGSQGARP